jgi:hypothetical protein
VLDLSLRAGAALPGRVVDERGGGIADARVRWGPAEGLSDRDLEDALRADAWLGARVLRTAADGSFRIEGLPPGRLLLKVEREGYADWYRSDLRVGTEGEHAAVRVELAGALVIRGRVRGGPASLPVGRAWVYARERAAGPDLPPDPGRVKAIVMAETAADGSFTLERIPPGLHEVVVWDATGFVAARQDWRNENARRAEVPAGATGVEFVLDPLPALEPPPR